MQSRQGRVGFTANAPAAPKQSTILHRKEAKGVMVNPSTAQQSQRIDVPCEESAWAQERLALDECPPPEMLEVPLSSATTGLYSPIASVRRLNRQMPNASGVQDQAGMQVTLPPLAPLLRYAENRMDCTAADMDTS
jgi:hypothetical protein